MRRTWSHMGLCTQVACTKRADIGAKCHSCSMCPRAHVCMSMHACVHTYMCVSLCRCTFMCVHVCAYLLMCLYICVPLCESAHPCVHVCEYINVSMFRVCRVMYVCVLEACLCLFPLMLRVMVGPSCPLALG